MPAAAGLGHLALLGEAGHDAVEVVLLDAHRLREFRDGDAGALAHEIQRLGGAGAAALGPAATARARPARASAGGPTLTTRARGGGRGRGGAVGNAVERLIRRLEQLVLVDVGLELVQPRLDLLALLVEKVGHLSVTPPRGVEGVKNGIPRRGFSRTGRCHSAFKKRFELLE